MSDDVMATAVEPVGTGRAALARKGEVALPGLIVDAGPVAAERFLEFFAARIDEQADAGGVRAGGGAVSGLVRGPGAGARGGLPAARGGLHPDPPRIRAHRQAALGRDPHARRLVMGRQPGGVGRPVFRQIASNAGIEGMITTGCRRFRSFSSQSAGPVRVSASDAVWSAAQPTRLSSS